MKRIRLLLLLGATLALPCGATRGLAQETVTDPRCEVPEDEVVSVSGTLLRLTFPGPPEYESIVGGDKPEHVLVLLLPQALCRAFENHVFHVQLLQLLPGRLAIPNSWVGREVTLRGRLATPETGHHHTGLLLTPTAGQRLTRGRGPRGVAK